MHYMPNETGLWVHGGVIGDTHKGQSGISVRASNL